MEKYEKFCNTFLLNVHTNRINNPGCLSGSKFGPDRLYDMKCLRAISTIVSKPSVVVETGSNELHNRLLS